MWTRLLRRLPKARMPADVISQEMIDRVERLVLKQRHIKVAKIASECVVFLMEMFTLYSMNI